MNESSESAARERVAPVLGIALALFVLIGLVGALFFLRSRSVDARETLASWFVVETLPFDLAAVESAVLANGDRVLRLAPAGGVVETERKTPPAPSPESPRFDWTKIELRPAGDAPCEVYLVRYPYEGSKPRLDALFEVAVQPGPGMLSASGGRLVLDRGALAWREWSAPFVLEREYEAGGTARDTVRVNLTREGVALACFARFPRGSTGSAKKVEELLAALAPR